MNGLDRRRVRTWILGHVVIVAALVATTLVFSERGRADWQLAAWCFVGFLGGELVAGFFRRRARRGRASGV